LHGEGWRRDRFQRRQACTIACSNILRLATWPDGAIAGRRRIRPGANGGLAVHRRWQRQHPLVVRGGRRQLRDIAGGSVGVRGGRFRRSGRRDRERIIRGGSRRAIGWRSRYRRSAVLWRPGGSGGSGRTCHRRTPCGHGRLRGELRDVERLLKRHLWLRANGPGLSTGSGCRRQRTTGRGGFRAHDGCFHAIRRDLGSLCSAFGLCRGGFRRNDVGWWWSWLGHLDGACENRLRRGQLLHGLGNGLRRRQRLRNNDAGRRRCHLRGVAGEEHFIAAPSNELQGLRCRDLAC
jgi:hypothetical protein